MNTRPCFVCLACLILTGSATADELPIVRVSQPLARKVTEHVDFTGRTQAVATVELRARVSGYLMKAFFKEGAEVKEGDLLFEIDARPYEAELKRTAALLAQAEAHLRRADADSRRAEALAARNAVGQDDVAKAAADRADADAGVRVARAGHESAQLNLSFSRVHAPINGRIGRRHIDPGNLVRADETVLAGIVSRDPIHVNFDMDERTVLRLRRSAREGKLVPRGEAVMPVTMGLADEQGYPRRGAVDFTDNQVDPKTGTLRMRAVFPNTDGFMLPGLFARVRLTAGEPYTALLVPEQAVETDKGQAFLLVVNDANVVERRQVVLGPSHAGLRVVRQGLGAEDRVVVGERKGLRPGMKVKPGKSAVPGSEKRARNDGGRGALAGTAGLASQG
jgi:RND family efflux transporter MFP subunit